MRFCFLLLIISFLFQLTATGQCGERYKSRYFNSIQEFRDVVYTKDAPALLLASLTTETIVNKDLVMDIFMPPNTDTVTNRPVVILGHGGGFINVVFMGGTALVGTMDNDDVQDLADTLAHWGFVTASIEYRLGFNPSSPSSINRAIWRGAQDMSAAIRFFRKNASWFGVDPNRVFSGGSSAGAFCAIHSTFIDHAERMADSYELVPFLKKDLGEMHSRPIVELTSFNPFNGVNVPGNDVDSIPRALAAYWGATTDLEAIANGNNQAPMIMFHGTGDQVVDYKCKKPFSSVIITGPTTCGTYMMDSVMTLNNMPHETHYGIGENHEYWGVLNGNWLPAGPNAYWPGIIQNTANFFYDIMKPTEPIVQGPDSVVTNTTYTYSIINPNPTYTYCWDVDGGTIVSQAMNGTSVDVQFQNMNSTGTVKARSEDEAKVASDEGAKSSAVKMGTSIDYLEALNLNMNLEPNPTKGTFSIKLNSANEISAEVRLYNLLGQELLSQDVELTKGEQLVAIDASHLAKGTYLVELKTAKGRLLKQVVLY